MYLQSILKTKMGIGELIEISYKSELSGGNDAIQAIINSTTHIPFKEELFMQQENPIEF